jgi:hypothetical protein
MSMPPTRTIRTLDSMFPTARAAGLSGAGLDLSKLDLDRLLMPVPEHGQLNVVARVPGPEGAEQVVELDQIVVRSRR